LFFHVLMSHSRSEIFMRALIRSLLFQSIIFIKISSPIVYGSIHRNVSDRRWLVLRYPLKELNANMILLAEKILNLSLLHSNDVNQPISRESLPLLGLPIALSNNRIFVLDLIQSLSIKTSGIMASQMTINLNKSSSFPNWESTW
jgi:hypothetical protein